MKKIIGIVIGLIVIAAIILGILGGKGKLSVPEAAPQNEVMVQIFDGYLTKIAKGDDEAIYNDMLSKKLKEQYTLSQITQMNDYVRGLGENKGYDKSKANYEKVIDNNLNTYVMSADVNFAKEPQHVRVKVIYEGKDLKIFAFSFSPIQK